jgi:hypothetical protein
MCDYSLHAVATRPAEVAETLVSTNFSTGTHGFASPDESRSAFVPGPRSHSRMRFKLAA